jgi:hypothetical protein
MPRMKHALPPLTKDLTEAVAASAWHWLVRLLVVLFSPRAERRRRRLVRLVQFAERGVEHILFLMAGYRLGSLDPRRRWRINARVIARPGFRIARGDNRLLWKSARIRLRGDNLIARVARLIEALANPERYVAHYIKRLARGLCFRRLVACAPPAAAVLSAAPNAVAFADSS